jgi:hypothetical protein
MRGAFSLPARGTRRREDVFMWEPRGLGVMIGWLTAASIGVYFMHEDMIRAGLFGESCALYGLESWSCGVLPKMAVWLPDMFVYFLTHPFEYDGSADWIGVDYATMWMGSPVAYGIALVATNYWVWKLNRL